MTREEMLNVPITEDLDHTLPDYLAAFNRSVPRKLHELMEHWYDTHSDGPTKFRTATVPLGMVMRWIERAEQAERMVGISWLTPLETSQADDTFKPQTR